MRGGEIDRQTDLGRVRGDNSETERERERERERETEGGGGVNYVSHEMPFTSDLTIVKLLHFFSYVSFHFRKSKG